MTRAGEVESPQELALQAIDQGVRRLLLLELSRVGTGQGTGTDDLFKAIQASSPRRRDHSRRRDLEDRRGPSVERPGAAAVLVGSAFHDGRIARDQSIASE